MLFVAIPSLRSRQSLFKALVQNLEPGADGPELIDRQTELACRFLDCVGIGNEVNDREEFRFIFLDVSSEFSDPNHHINILIRPSLVTDGVSLFLFSVSGNLVE